MTNLELEEFLKKRLADRYTSSELMELLDISVEEVIDLFWDRIPDYVLEELR